MEIEKGPIYSALDEARKAGKAEAEALGLRFTVDVDKIRELFTNTEHSALLTSNPTTVS